MKKLIRYVLIGSLLAVVTLLLVDYISERSIQQQMATKNFYDFEARTLAGKEMKMADTKGKVVLVVNTASKCGFTPQYAGLETLYEKYKDKGLVIIGFPCNQFGAQEPGGSGEIQEFCQVNYGVTFPIMSKVDVNGDNADPIFKYLKSQLGGILGSRIKWNFTKFLLDRNGKPVERFSPLTTPDKIEPAIQKLL